MKVMQYPKSFIWVVLILIVGLVAYLLGNQGRTVRRLDVGTEGLSLEFEEYQRIPEAELEQRQDKLDRKLKDIEEKFSRIPQSKLYTTQPVYNLSGTWHSPIGILYNISQYGNAITIQEVNPMFGVTAIGQGVINQQTVNINYVNALYAQGRGVLKLSNDGRQMSGTFTDLSNGFTTNAILFRQENNQ